MHLDCEPAFDYGRARADWDYGGAGYHDGVAPPRAWRCACDSQRHAARLRGSARRARDGLHAGETRFCALGWSEHLLPATLQEAREQLSCTGNYWHEWISRGSFPDHPWRAYLQRSALTLKGLTYAPTGAMMAAATTSLPETPGGERNWDYRYSWMRDSTFMLWGLYMLGFEWEANDYFYFIADVAEAAEAACR